MKNTKLIALVAVLLVVSVVVSVVISTSGNGKIDDAIEAIKNETAGKLDKLEETINKQNGTINDLEEKLEQAQKENEQLKEEIESSVNSGNVSAEDFEAATAALPGQLEKLDKVVTDYKNETNDLGESVLNPTLYYDWETYHVAALKKEAVNALNRAISVAQQDKIVADFAAAIRVIPNQAEELIALVASIEADGVTAKDKDAVDRIRLHNMTVTANAELFEGADLTAKNKTKANLAKKYNDLYKEYQVAIRDNFVAMVAALPEIEDAKLTDRKALTEAENYLAYITSHNVDLTKSAVRKASEKLVELDTRIDTLEVLKNTADALNDKIAKAFDGKQFLLNTATLNIIAGLEEEINVLFYGTLKYLPTDPNYDAEDPDRNKDGWDELYDWNLNPNSPSCNTYVYNFVDVAAVEAYRAKYEGLKEELKAQAKVFYDAVKAYDDVTNLQSYYDAEKAATTAYSEILAIVGMGQITSVDTLLGNTTNDDKIEMGIDKDGDGVEDEVFPFEGHYYVYKNTILADIAAIDADVKAVVDYISKTVRDLVCTDPTHVPAGYTPAGGQRVCNCQRTDKNATFGSINETLVKNNVAAFKNTISDLKALMSGYEFTATEILGDNYADYLAVAAQVLEIIADEHIETNVATDNQGACKLLVDRALANGVVFEMTYGEDLDNDDVKDANEYVWAKSTQGVFDMLNQACGAVVFQ